MPAPITAYLALGSNLGDRASNLESALRLLDGRGVAIRKRSSIYETAPRGFSDQPWFLNMVVQASTELPPLALLNLLQGVERELGRERLSTVRFGPRTIDLDLLLFGCEAIATPLLTVPHPRMAERRFVLQPLLEIAPEVSDPVSGRHWRDFAPAVQDQEIRLFSD